MVASEEEEPREVVDRLTERLGLSIAQSSKVPQYIADNGLGYVQEKVTIVQSKPRNNVAGAFMKALQDDWKAPRSSEAVNQAVKREKALVTQDVEPPPSEQQIAVGRGAAEGVPVGVEGVTPEREDHRSNKTH